MVRVDGRERNPGTKPQLELWRYSESLVVILTITVVNLSTSRAISFVDAPRWSFMEA